MEQKKRAFFIYTALIRVFNAAPLCLFKLFMAVCVKRKERGGNGKRSEIIKSGPSLLVTMEIHVLKSALYQNSPMFDCSTLLVESSDITWDSWIEDLWQHRAVDPDLSEHGLREKVAFCSKMKGWHHVRRLPAGTRSPTSTSGACSFSWNTASNYKKRPPRRYLPPRRSSHCRTHI